MGHTFSPRTREAERSLFIIILSTCMSALRKRTLDPMKLQ
ncbi:rCG59698 [Rattus norvegicus]|uniref:RCG59698 n=1 Tax=Rattus norvegicus TaxID=10116 RepID=A6HRL9_RAT|nr:rCG59698 [Rattus norvegicus]